MRRPYAVVLTFALAVAGVALPATAAGAVEPPRVRVTPGSSSVLLGETRQLTVTVTGLANTAVTWSLRHGAGSVDASGLYTPPATLPADPVAVVRATSAEDALVYGEATISVASGVPAGGFAPGVPVTGGSYDTDAGDVNGDGVADVVRLQIGANSLQLVRIVALVSDGAGGFTTKTSGYSYLGSVNDFFGDIVLGDFDSDGDLDVYAAIEAVSTAFNEYTLFRNDGSGGFTPDAVVTAGSGEGRAGARARGTDFDGDGKLDVVRLDRFGTVTLHKGVGNGTFATAVSLFSTAYAVSLAVGDVTGDGRPDVAVGTRTVGGSPIMETFDVVTNDGFGGIATKTTYTASLDPTPTVYDADGDGWNDLVVGAGSAGATHYPPKLLVFRNQATGTGALATTGVQAAAFRPFDLHPAHVDGDGVLDLAGATNHGPVLLRRTGANTFAAMHSTSHVPHHVAVGDFTGDGRTDVYTTSDNVSAFFAGTADTTFAFAVDPVVTWINAGHTAPMSASIRNSTALPEVVWSASRGTFPAMFDRHHYTAPSTASPTGTPVTVTATLSGTQLTASRQILVVNEKFQFTSLGGQHVRQVVTDPSVATTLYAATGSGVYRLNNGGTTAQLLGPTTATGTDAKEVAVVRDGATAALVARFASGIWRLDLTDPAAVWTDADGGAFSAVSVDALPGTGTVFAATSTGAVRRSTDGGLTWNVLGGTSVTKVVAIGPDTVWAVRSAAPRVTVGTYAEGTLTLTPRELPEPAAAVHTLAVDPDDRTKAFVAIAESNGRRLFRGTTAGEWTASPVPAVVNQLAVAPDGHVLAADDDTQSVFKSVDDGASWYSLYRGFATNLNVTTVAARADSLTLVGSASGLYTPVDLEPPAVPAVTAGPAGTTGPGGSNAFSFTFTPTGASHLCALDDKAWVSCSGSSTYSGPLTSGSHTFSVVAVDENGNESAPGTWSWTVDATPPAVPTITSGPPALTNQTTATFAFTGPGDATGLVCTLDAGTPAACAESKAYTGLGEGAHTFAVRSVDEYGNQSAAATRSWTVDVTPPPYFGFTRVPAYWGGSTVTGDATFTWAVDPSLTYACALDSAPVTCAGGSYSATGLADGGHTFRVTASDAAGNARTAAHFWVVDTTPPGPVTITLAPPSSTTETTARFEYTSDTWAFDCALDGERVPCWSDGATLSGLAPGTHTFTVAGRDDHNRLGPETSYTWTVVADPPPAAPVIESGPSGWARSRTATFTYSLPEGTTAKCALDGGAPAPCDATGVTYTELAEGPHTFAVHAVSPTGKPSTPAAASWTVDVTPPAAPAIASGPPARTAAGSATFGWTADDTLGYRCAVDGVTVTCGTGTYTATGLPDGGHNFTLRAVDAAGNESPAAVRGWTIDRTGPTVSLGTVPAAATNVTTAAFAFSTSATDVASFECTVDGDPVDCADGSAEVTVPGGEHTFRVVATDDLGNRGPEVTYDWVVDTIAPVTEIAATTTSLTAARLVRWDEPVAALSGAQVRLEITGTTSAVTAALDCRDAANAAVPCSGAGVRTVLLTPASPLVAGQRYTLRVAGVADAAGNVAETVTTAFRASTSEQETTAGAKAAWRTVTSPAAQGGSYAVADVSGASVTIPFTGTGITFYGVRGPSFGTADVYVDAEKTPRLRVSYYSSSAGTLAKSVSGLANAKHTLRIVVRGEQGSTRGTGTHVGLDAVKVGATTSKTPAATYAWARRSASGASGGAYALDDSRGASYTMSFRGTAFSWVTVLGPQMGKATVTIDGKSVTVDNYASAVRYGYVRRFAGLSDAVHVVKVTVLGERRSGATGAYVAVDRFAIT